MRDIEQSPSASAPAGLIDRLAEGTVVVFGSLPPDGRDLDLLVRPAEEALLEAGLADAGFVHSAGHWARFARCTAEAVELVPVARWGLGEGETEALFREALPLDGCDHLARPGPSHVLLIAARRLAAGDGRLDDRRRRRVLAAAEEDPGAWARARERAPAWGVERALRWLESAAQDGSGLDDRVGLTAAIEQRRRAGAGLGQAWASSLRARFAPAPRGRLVTFSGVDGSGKTLQAHALRETLERLGFEAAVEWTRLSYNPSLDVVAAPVKAALRLLSAGRDGGPPAQADSSSDDDRVRAVGDERARSLREGSALVNYVWAGLVAGANGVSQRRATRRHLRAGRVVVCDRHTLDSAAHLRFRYGAERRFRLQSRLIRLISPAPIRAYFLDISGETAWARKPERYTADELVALAELYREEWSWLGIERLDGERAPDDLCREVATAVWLDLRAGRGRRLDALRSLARRRSPRARAAAPVP